MSDFVQERVEKDFTLCFCLKRADGSPHDPNNLNYSENAQVMLGMKVCK